jgi:DNA repair exonuclease SbcCD ATPase subunit
MGDNEATTKPTIETIIERLNELRDEMRAGFNTVNDRLERVEIRLDRVESMALEARADMREFRSDFKKFRERLKFPA